MINDLLFEADHPDVTALPQSIQAAITGKSVREPKAGQVWRLAWSGLPPRLACITTVGDCFVNAVPVTLTARHRVDSAFVDTEVFSGIDATIWPQIRTGLGDFILAEFLGEVSEGSRSKIEDRAPGRYSATDLDSWNRGEGAPEVMANRAYRDRLVVNFAAFCDSDWNEADRIDGYETYVDQEIAQVCGLTLANLARIAGVSTGEAYAIWQAERPLSYATRESLLGEYGEAIQDALRSTPVDRLARRAIDSPFVRNDIYRIATGSASDEGNVRYELYIDLVSAPRRMAGSMANRRSPEHYSTQLRLLLSARLQELEM